MGAGSFGFQFGAQASEFVLLVMSQRGVESLLTGTFKLGGDISVAVGPIGAVIATRDEWNRDYYGTEVRPTDILVRQAVTNPQSAGLKAALALAAKGKASAGQTSTFVPE
jgi:lipid-binding SYLF domain-containing protein